MTIDKILKQNFGLTGKAESFNKKPKKVIKYNPELYMNAYAFIIEDKYRQHAEAATLRSEVMLMRAKGYSEASILKKVANAGKDLWRIIKTLIDKLIIMIKQFINMNRLKIKKARKLCDNMKKLAIDTTNWEYHFNLHETTLDGEDVYELKQSDDVNTLADDLNTDYYGNPDSRIIYDDKKWTGDHLTKHNYDFPDYDAEYGRSHPETLKDLCTGYNTGMIEGIEVVLQKGLERIIENQKKADEKHPVSLRTLGIFNINAVACIMALENSIKYAKLAAENYTKKAKNIMHIKNAPTSVTDELTPEEAQDVRKYVQAVTAVINLHVKINKTEMGINLKCCAEMYKMQQRLEKEFKSGKMKELTSSPEVKEKMHDMLKDYAKNFEL